MKMFIQFLLYLLIVTTSCSAGAVIADNTIHPADVLRNIQTRQTINECVAQFLDNIPSFCNQTLLTSRFSTGDSDLSDLALLTDAQLSALNDAYSQTCVSACVGPLVSYFRCLPVLSDTAREYAINRIERGICGQQDGDYCEVRYIRRYHDNDDYNITIANQVGSSCTFSNTTGIICNSSTTPQCLSLLSNFNVNMGCCARPYLGSGISSCSGHGLSVNESCTGVSGATAHVAPVAIITLVLFAFLGLIL